MVRYEVTAKLADTLRSGDMPQDEVRKVTKGKYLTRRQLIALYKTHKPTSTLIELVRLTRLQVDNKNNKSSKPKTKEFLELMERLRLEQQEKEYRKLVEPRVDFSTLYEPTVDKVTIAQINKETKSYLTTVVNIIISVASVVYAIWYWTDTSWKLKDTYRVLLCLFFGLLILVAEVVVYMSYLNKVEEAKTKERSKPEKKKLVKRLE